MQGQEPQGCLTAILRLFGVPIHRTKPAVPLSDGNNHGLASSALDDPTETEPSGPLPYRLRDDFLSAAEFSFYRVLLSAVGNRGMVCPKVNLWDVFFVARPNENYKFKGKIDRKHVDFLVCHPRTMKPLFGVELDDKSHNRADRVERDEFVDEVFQVAGLPLIHQPARASYQPQALAAELSPFFNEPISETTPTLVAATSTPICPKCGVPMVQRTASKGQNAGKQFWGCSNYPRCREIV